MPHPPLLRVLSAVTMLATLDVTFAGCSNGANDDAAKAAAIQKALDVDHPVQRVVPDGRNCDDNEPKQRGDYAHLSFLRVADAGTERNRIDSGPRILHCSTYTWLPPAQVVTVRRPYSWMTDAKVTIGRMVVDKVGAEQDTGAGKTTPFTAHFVPNDVGKALLSRNLAKAPKDVSDGAAVLHKDANGAWVAQL